MNDFTLTFFELYQNEPVHSYRKNRKQIYDSWVRLIRQLQRCVVTKLKNKKKTCLWLHLEAICVKKIEKNLQSDQEPEQMIFTSRHGLLMNVSSLYSLWINIWRGRGPNYVGARDCSPSSPAGRARSGVLNKKMRVPATRGQPRVCCVHSRFLA